MVKLESKKKKKMEGNKETRLAIEAKWLLLREPPLPVPTGRRRKDVWGKNCGDNCSGGSCKERLRRSAAGSLA